MCKTGHILFTSNVVLVISSYVFHYKIQDIFASFGLKIPYSVLAGLFVGSILFFLFNRNKLLSSVIITILLTCFVLYFYNNKFYLPIILGLLLGSVLPDIDDPRSYIGRILPISFIFKLLLGHRGLTHWLIFAIALGSFALILEKNSFLYLFLISCSIGCILHDLADSLTDGGIVGFFWPLFPRTRFVLLPAFLRAKTNTMSEFYIMFLMILALVYNLSFLFGKDYA